MSLVGGPFLFCKARGPTHTGSQLWLPCPSTHRRHWCVRCHLCSITEGVPEARAACFREKCVPASPCWPLRWWWWWRRLLCCILQQTFQNRYLFQPLFLGIQSGKECWPEEDIKLTELSVSCHGMVPPQELHLCCRSHGILEVSVLSTALSFFGNYLLGLSASWRARICSPVIPAEDF